MGTGLLFGFAPAWIASRPILASALKGEDGFIRPGRRLNLRNVLVVAQIVMSLVLLCATGLFLRSLQRAVGIDIGFRSRDLLMLSVDPRVHGLLLSAPPNSSNNYASVSQRFPASFRWLLQTAPRCPEETEVTVSAWKRIEAHRPQSNRGAVYGISGLFRNHGDPTAGGSRLRQRSANGSKVAIVNRAFAERFFPRENPIGQRVNGGGVSYEIIGVVQNIKSRTLGEDTRYVLFRSLAQSTGSDPSSWDMN